MDSTVKIYITAEDMPFETYREQLQNERRSEIEKLKRAEIRNEKTTASVLLDYALTDAGLTAAADKIVIKENENSKPFLKNGGAFFSISHSRGITACAVSLEKEVGLDIEFHRVLHSFAAAKKMFAKEELAAFSNFSDNEKSAALLKRWTLFESFFKLTGEGVKAFPSLPPAAFDELFPNVFSREDFIFNSRPALIHYNFSGGVHISCAVCGESGIEIVKV